MSPEIQATLVGLFCTVISSIVTFLLTRRKYNAEVESQQIENMNSSFEIYKKNMKETLDMQNKRIADLEQENALLKKQIESLREQLSALLIAKVETVNNKASKKSKKQ